jgi:hypothetical protein
MTFDFGFNLTPSVEVIKKDNLLKRKSTSEKIINKISQSKVFNRDVLDFLRNELDNLSSIKQKIKDAE